MSRTKALTKEERQEATRRHKEKEMTGRSLLDRWWGVEGISAPLGDPRAASDDTLEWMARRMQRGLEDVRDGIAEQAEPDLSNEQVEENLREVEREQGARETLRYSWGAAERGTDDYDEFCQAGGLRMIAEVRRSGQEPLIRPSYRLAAFMDWGRWLEGRLTALDWSANAPKGCYESTWAREAWRKERAAYYAWADAERLREGAWR
jgi:hypothetical protein